MSWNDFNSAEEQNDFDIIPKGVLAKVRMTIRPGGYDDPSQGWDGGYATLGEASGAIYLNCEFVVLEGDYARRKIWSLIGLHSEKGPEWQNIGRALIKGILNSARGLQPKDNTPQAQQARTINGLHDLDGIEFVAKVGIEKDMGGEEKNVIKVAITPDNKDYFALMSGTAVTVGAQVAPQQFPAATHSQAVTPSQMGGTQAIQQNPVQGDPTNRPSWAK